MPSISLPTAMLIAGGVSAGAGLIGSSQQAGAAKDAAALQYQASKDAAALQWQMFQQMQGNLQPYMQTGVNALNSLAMLTGTAGSNDAQIRQLQQQLQALTGGQGAGTGGGATPGVLAAQAAGTHSHGLGTDNLLWGIHDPFSKGASPIQDIAAALQQNLPISDASWASAGFGPGGAARTGTGTASGAPNPLGGMNPVAGFGGVNAVAGGGASGAGGTPAAGVLSPDVQAQVQAIQDQIRTLQGSNQPGNPLTAPLTSPFQPTMQQLEQTPGYQFTLNQGLRATQNSATAMGLGQSGSAIAGAGDYAAGLASQTYQQQFSNYWSQNQNIYNMLAGLAQQGQASAAGVGSAGLQTGGNIGNLLTGGASALGAGQIGAANAWAGGLSNAAGAGGNAALMLALSKNGLFGGSGGGGAGVGGDGSGSYVYGGAAGFQPAGSWAPGGYAY